MDIPLCITNKLKDKTMCNHLNFNEIYLHDCRVYGWGIIPDSYKLLMDVDWITSRELQNESYRFCISPCTFMFSNIWDIDIDIGMNLTLTIDNMEVLSVQEPRNSSVLSEDTKEYTCRINFLEGSFTFRTIDFIIIQRKEEIETTITNLLNEEREGISLSTNGSIYQVKF